MKKFLKDFVGECLNFHGGLAQRIDLNIAIKGIGHRAGVSAVFIGFGVTDVGI